MRYQVGTTLAVLSALLHLVKGHFDANRAPQHDGILGDGCASNEGCETVKYAYCNIVSPTCGMGRCECTPGFAQVYNRTGCHAIRQVGDPCGPGDYCSDPYAECYNGRCTCLSGFSSIDGLCSTRNKRKKLGERCSDPVECIGHLTCLNNECGCYSQYKVAGCCDCVKKSFGDECGNDGDCIYASNSICQRGTCVCDRTSRPVDYMSITEDRYSKYQITPTKCVKKAACLSHSQKLGQEGDMCSEPNTKDPSQPFRLCEAPFVCTPCTSFYSVCASRPYPCFRTLPSGAVAGAAAALLVTVLCIVALVSLVLNEISAL